VPFAAMVNGLKKWKENTSTSPSGKHLGIYKSFVNALTYNIGTEAELTETTISLPSIAQKGLTIQHLLINLAIQHKHTYHQWTKVHNIFIKKLPGVPLLDKLRVIHIYEADWNLILKYYTG
jgi:hypothetical protein